jgi:hypothetical protein
MNINHYVYIKKLDVFASNNKKDENGRHTCKNHFICNRCLYPFSSKDRLERHIQNGCDKFEPVRIELPKSKYEDNMEIKPTITFKDFHKKLPVPVFITADFETLIQPSNDTAETNKTEKIADLPPCSYAFNIISDYPELNCGLTSYRAKNKDANVAEHFIKSLLEYGGAINQILKTNKPMIITEEQEKQFQDCEVCYLCEGQAIDKVRDHDHMTGLYRGCACNICNINFNYKNFKIPVFFHNLKGFDGHLIIQGLKK